MKDLRLIRADIMTHSRIAARWLDAWALDPDTMNDWARLVAAVPISHIETRVTIAVEQSKYNPVVVATPAVIAKRFPAYLTLIADDVHEAHAPKGNRKKFPNNKNR